MRQRRLVMKQGGWSFYEIGERPRGSLGDGVISTYTDHRTMDTVVTCAGFELGRIPWRTAAMPTGEMVVDWDLVRDSVRRQQTNWHEAMAKATESIRAFGDAIGQFGDDVGDMVEEEERGR